MPCVKNKNLYIRISEFILNENLFKNLQLTINKFYNKKIPFKNIIFDIRNNEDGQINILNYFLNIFFKDSKKYKYKSYFSLDEIKMNDPLLKYHKQNNNLSCYFDDYEYKYKNNIKKKLSNQFIVLIDNITYSASLNFIKNLNFRIKDNKNEILLIGNKTSNVSKYGGSFKDFIFPSNIGNISIPLGYIKTNDEKNYNSENFTPDIYRNYDHINNPDDLIDGVIADVEAYKNGFKFSDKENAYQFKKDLFAQPVDDDKFVLPNKKYYPKLETI